MKIFSILCVKNEGDIIGECLRRASLWSDRIFVYDGASTDGTWETVQAMANDRIVAARSDNQVWNDYIRAQIFEEFRHEARDGDWWCRLDADEFYIDEPRAFLSTVALLHHSVWGLKLEYYLTEETVAQMPEGQPPAEASPLDYLRYYRCNDCEPRFFRYRQGLRWGPRDSAPTHLGLTSPKLIRFKHLPYRFPNQIQRRIRQRIQSVADGHEHPQGSGWSVIVDDWKKMGYRDAADLQFDAGDGQYQFDPEKLSDYLGPTWRRGVQWICHSTGIWP